MSSAESTAGRSAGPEAEASPATALVAGSFTQSYPATDGSDQLLETEPAPFVQFNMLVGVLFYLFGLALVGRDHGRLAAQADPHRLAVGVEDRDDSEGAQLGDQAGVEVGIDAGRRKRQGIAIGGEGGGHGLGGVARHGPQG